MSSDIVLPEWGIYYGDGRIIRGHTAEEWHSAPDDNVQVVVRWQIPDRRPWVGVDDRELWTGTNEFDPFGWGVKYGKWMTDDAYFALWEVAAYGPRNA